MSASLKGEKKIKQTYIIYYFLEILPTIFIFIKYMYFVVFFWRKKRNTEMKRPFDSLRLLGDVDKYN